MDTHHFVEQHLICAPNWDAWFILVIVTPDEAHQIREWVRSKVGVSLLRLNGERYRIDDYKEAKVGNGRVRVEIGFKPVVY